MRKQRKWSAERIAYELTPPSKTRLLRTKMMCLLAQVPDRVAGEQADQHVGFDAAVEARVLPSPHLTANHPGAHAADRRSIVQPRDTLSGIDARFGIDWQTVYSANRAR